MRSHDVQTRYERAIRDARVFTVHSALLVVLLGRAPVWLFYFDYVKGTPCAKA